jgi:hypothetical protein
MKRDFSEAGFIHDRPQHDGPSTCVTAQQYSSATFVSLRFHYLKQNSARVSKILLHDISYILNLASLEISYVGAVIVVHTEDISGGQSC